MADSAAVSPPDLGCRGSGARKLSFVSSPQAAFATLHEWSTGISPFPPFSSQEHERVRESCSHTLSLAVTGTGNGGKLTKTDDFSSLIPDADGNTKISNINNLSDFDNLIPAFPSVSGNERERQFSGNSFSGRQPI